MNTLTKYIGSGLLLTLLMLAACDNVADQQAAPLDGQALMADFESVVQSFDQAYRTSTPESSEAAQTLLNEVVAEHDGGMQARSFGPSQLELCSDDHLSGTLEGAYPAEFDMHTYELTGGTGMVMIGFQLLEDDVRVGAQVCVDGDCQIFVSDEGEGLITINDVEAPATVTFGIAYIGDAPASGPAVDYRAGVWFKNDSCTPPDCTVTEGCITVDLLGITINNDGSSTYDFKVTSNCDRGLSFIAFELPESVHAALNPFASVDLIAIENPGGHGGASPPYNNIKFELGGDFKDGDMGTFSFTLPAGADYDGEIRIKTKSGQEVLDLTLDISNCED